MPFHMNVLLGGHAAYNHNALVVRITFFLVCDKIVDHRFPIARPQLRPKSRPGFLDRFYELFMASSEEVAKKFADTDLKKQTRPTFGNCTKSYTKKGCIGCENRAG